MDINITDDREDCGENIVIESGTGDNLEETKDVVVEQEPLEEIELKIEDDEPKEFEIPLEQVDENIIPLKKKSDVYYEMYRKALNKAKMAKDLALSSFLEAKQIKNTYMLDDIEDDSDLDDNISLGSE